MNQLQRAVPDTNSRVIVLLNGDMFPNRGQPGIQSGATYISGRTQLPANYLTSPWAKERVIQNAVPTFIRYILEQYRNAHVVFNLGNHEFFCEGATLLPGILGYNTNEPIRTYRNGPALAQGITMLGEFIRAGRFHIISDAQQRNPPLVQFQRSVTVHGIPIIGYCTHNHTHSIRPTAYVLPTQFSGPVSQLLTQGIQASGRVIFAAHAHANEASQILASVAPYQPQNSIIVFLGHWHDNFANPNADLHRQYTQLQGVYQSPALGQGLVHVTLR
jgi:hypothetical protein